MNKVELDYIYKFYQDVRTSSRVHYPHSDVFYVQKALAIRFGIEYTVEHIEISMWLEGILNPNDVKKIPEWYWKKYMGQEPDFDGLRLEVEKKHRQRLELKIPVAEALEVDSVADLSLTNVVMKSSIE